MVWEKGAAAVPRWCGAGGAARARGTALLLLLMGMHPLHRGDEACGAAAAGQGH